jgi:hypothetical protein
MYAATALQACSIPKSFHVSPFLCCCEGSESFTAFPCLVRGIVSFWVAGIAVVLAFMTELADKHETLALGQEFSFPT